MPRNDDRYDSLNASRSSGQDGANGCRTTMGAAKADVYRARPQQGAVNYGDVSQRILDRTPRTREYLAKR